ncbi:MAG: hypothetical protein IKK08_05880 [Clostridia bacterium]|nr:hypothetical protein [Clostridia bacterium]
MSVHEETQTRRLLLIGLVASVATVLGGELPIGWVVYPKVANDPTGLLGMMMGSADLQLWQLAAGALVGGVCIPLQYYGFQGCAKLVEAGDSPGTAGIIRVGAAATGFLGGIVHVVCVALMFLCRMVDFSVAVLPRPLMDFALWMVMPVSVVFMPVYYAMCIALFAAVVRKKTDLPRWAAVLNPLTGTLVLNALPMLLPPSAFVNALGMANMGLGSVLTFGGLLCLIKRK